jgi:hypothetical protein
MGTLLAVILTVTAQPTPPTAVEERPAAEREQLLRNGGFEVPGRERPAHWRLYVREMEGAYGRVSDRARSGEQSVELYTPEPYDVETANNWSQNILGPVGGLELTLTGYIATEEATEAAVWVQCYEAQPARVIAQRSTSLDSPMWGTSDWQEVRLELQVPERADFLVVRCVLMGKGAAWFDDIGLWAARTAASPPPEGAAERRERPSREQLADLLAGEDLHGVPPLLPPEMTRGILESPGLMRENESTVEWLQGLYGEEGGMEARRLLSARRELARRYQALQERNEALLEEVDALREENDELRRRLDILENRLPRRPRAPQAPQRPERPNPFAEEES